MSQLKELYRQQEEIDRQIAELFRQRMENCEEISNVKIAAGAKLIDKAKDKEQLERVLSYTSDSLTDRVGTAQLLSQMQSVAQKRQYQILAEKGSGGRLPFIAVDEIDKENVRVVYQGVEGAYSHAAMCRFFGDDVNCFHVDSWRDAMEAIADGEADYAVLPIENSSAGIVADNYDLLIDFENYIVGEQVIRCEHVLMAPQGASLADIRTVISHPQALAQCSRYLDQHENWKRRPSSNTALAAREVAETKDKSLAAIGSEFAAGRFGLKVLARKISFNEANSTRFIIATNQRIFRRDAGKISICFELPHKSGALYSILSHFIYNGLNMNRIESRPITGRNWEYHFFVDFEGNLGDSSVKSALRGIRSEALNMKILGNY